MKMRVHAWRAKTSQRLALSKEMKCRKRTLHEVRTGTWWLGAEGLDVLQRQAWKNSGQVFSVVDCGVELFPMYQFLRIGGRLEPRPCLRQVLEEFRPLGDGWALAAWFHYPDAWLVERDGRQVTHISPAEALRRGMDDRVVEVAQKRLGSYVA